MIKAEVKQIETGKRQRVPNMASTGVDTSEEYVFITIEYSSDTVIICTETLTTPTTVDWEQEIIPKVKQKIISLEEEATKLTNIKSNIGTIIEVTEEERAIAKEEIKKTF